MDNNISHISEETFKWNPALRFLYVIYNLTKFCAIVSAPFPSLPLQTLNYKDRL